MKKLFLFFVVAIITGAMQNLFAQNEDPMKAYQDFMTPGEHHKRLAKEVGTWEADITHWMEPSAPPGKTTGINVVTMTMNGLYQVGNFSCTIMGMAMTGQSILAFDNAKKKYVLTWIDNFGSGIVMMTGTYNDAAKTLSLKGKQTNPVTGADGDLREEIKYINDDMYTVTMYGAGMDGKEMKMMESIFKRKK